MPDPSGDDAEIATSPDAKKRSATAGDVDARDDELLTLCQTRVLRRLREQRIRTSVHGGT
jgi:hypothetical protein